MDIMVLSGKIILSVTPTPGAKSVKITINEIAPNKYNIAAPNPTGANNPDGRGGIQWEAIGQIYGPYNLSISNYGALTGYNSTSDVPVEHVKAFAKNVSAISTTITDTRAKETDTNGKWLAGDSEGAVNKILNLGFIFKLRLGSGYQNATPTIKYKDPTTAGGGYTPIKTINDTVDGANWVYYWVQNVWSDVPYNVSATSMYSLTGVSSPAQDPVAINIAGVAFTSDDTEAAIPYTSVLDTTMTTYFKLYRDTNKDDNMGTGETNLSSLSTDKSKIVVTNKSVIYTSTVGIEIELESSYVNSVISLKYGKDKASSVSATAHANYTTGSKTRKFKIENVTTEIGYLEFIVGAQEKISITFKYLEAEFLCGSNFGADGVYDESGRIDVSKIGQANVPSVPPMGLIKPKIAGMAPFGNERVVSTQTVTLQISNTGAFTNDLSKTTGYEEISSAYRFVGWVVGNDNASITSLSSAYGNVSLGSKVCSFSFVGNDILSKYAPNKVLNIYAVIVKKEKTITTVNFLEGYGEMYTGHIAPQFSPSYVAGTDDPASKTYRVGNTFFLPHGADFNNPGFTFMGWYVKGATYAGTGTATNTIDNIYKLVTDKKLYLLSMDEYGSGQCVDRKGLAAANVGEDEDELVIVACWVKSTVKIAFQNRANMEESGDVGNMPTTKTFAFGAAVNYTDLISATPTLEGWVFNGFLLGATTYWQTGTSFTLGRMMTTDQGVHYIQAAAQLPYNTVDRGSNAYRNRQDSVFPYFGLNDQQLLARLSGGVTPEEYTITLVMQWVAEEKEIHYWADAVDGTEIFLDTYDDEKAYFPDSLSYLVNFKYTFKLYRAFLNGELQQQPSAGTNSQKYRIQLQTPVWAGRVFDGWELSPPVTLGDSSPALFVENGTYYLRSDHFVKYDLVAKWHDITVTINYMNVPMADDIVVRGTTFAKEYVGTDKLKFMTASDTNTISSGAFYQEGYTLVGWIACDSATIPLSPTSFWRGVTLGADEYGRAEYVGCDSLDPLYGTDNYAFTTYANQDLYKTLFLPHKYSLVDKTIYNLVAVWERNVISITFSESVDGTTDISSKIEAARTANGAVLNGVTLKGGAAVSAVSTTNYVKGAAENPNAVRQVILQFTTDADEKYNPDATIPYLRGTVSFAELMRVYSPSRDGYNLRGYYIYKQDFTANANLNATDSYRPIVSAIWFDGELRPMPDCDFTRIVAGRNPTFDRTATLTFEEIRFGSAKLVIVPIWEAFGYQMQVLNFDVAGTQNQTHTALSPLGTYKYETSGFTINVNDLMNKNPFMNLESLSFAPTAGNEIDPSWFIYRVGGTELYGEEVADPETNETTFTNVQIIGCGFDQDGKLTGYTLRHYDTTSSSWVDATYGADIQLTITIRGARLDEYLYARYLGDAKNPDTGASITTFIYAKFKIQEYDITINQMWTENVDGVYQLADRGRYLGALYPMAGHTFTVNDELDGSGNVINRTVITKHVYGTDTYIPEPFGVTGYQFDGWFVYRPTANTFFECEFDLISTPRNGVVDGQLTGERVWESALGAYGYSGSVTLYAKFIEVDENGKPKRYSVNFNMGGVPETVYKIGGKSDIGGVEFDLSKLPITINALTVQKTDGAGGWASTNDYEFLGWIKVQSVMSPIPDTNFGTPTYTIQSYDFKDGDGLDIYSITLVARWRLRAIKVTYNYLEQNGITTAQKVYDYNTEKLPSGAEIGWTDPNGYGYRITDYVPETADTAFRGSGLNTRANPTSPITKAQADAGYYIGAPAVALGSVGLGTATGYFNALRFVGWQKDTTADFLGWQRGEQMQGDTVFTAVYKPDVRPLMYLLDRLDRLDTREPWEDGSTSTWTVTARDQFNTLRTTAREFAEGLMFESSPADATYDRVADVTALTTHFNGIATFMSANSLDVQDDACDPLATDGFNPLNTAYLTALRDLLDEYSNGIAAGVVDVSIKNWDYSSDKFTTNGDVSGSQIVTIINALLNAEQSADVSAARLIRNVQNTAPQIPEGEHVVTNYGAYADIIEMENRVRDLLETLGAFDGGNQPIHLAAIAEMLSNANKYIRILNEYATDRTDRDGLEFPSLRIWEELFHPEMGKVQEYKNAINHKDAGGEYDIKMTALQRILRELDIMVAELGLRTDANQMPKITKQNGAPIYYPVSKRADRETVINAFEMKYLLKEYSIAGNMGLVDYLDLLIDDRDYLINPDQQTLTMENIWELKYGYITTALKSFETNLAAASQSLYNSHDGEGDEATWKDGFAQTILNDAEENPSFGVDFTIYLPKSKSAYVDTATPAYNSSILKRLVSVAGVVTGYLLDDSIVSDEFATELIGINASGKPIRLGGKLVDWYASAELAIASAVQDGSLTTQSQIRGLLYDLNDIMHQFMSAEYRGNIERNRLKPAAGDAIPEILSVYDVDYLKRVYERLSSYSNGANEKMRYITSPTHDVLLVEMGNIYDTLDKAYKQLADPTRVFEVTVTYAKIYEHIAFVANYLLSENVEQLTWGAQQQMWNNQTVTWYLPIPKESIPTWKMANLKYYLDMMEEARPENPDDLSTMTYEDYNYAYWMDGNPFDSISGTLDGNGDGNGRAWQLYKLASYENMDEVDAMIVEIRTFLDRIGFVAKDVSGLFEHLKTLNKLMAEYASDEASGVASGDLRRISRTRAEVQNMLSQGVKGVSFKTVRNQINEIIALFDDLGEDFTEFGFTSTANGTTYSGEHYGETFKYVMAVGGAEHQWDLLDLLLFQVTEYMKTMEDGQLKTALTAKVTYAKAVLDAADETPYPDSSVLELWVVRQDMEEFILGNSIEIVRIDRVAPRPDGGDGDDKNAFLPMIIAGVSIGGLILLFILIYIFVIRPNMKKKQALAENRF
jgi:hypothetical protein